MHRKQQGMTAIGVILVLGFLSLFGFAGMRLIPMYLEQVFGNQEHVLEDLKELVKKDCHGYKE
jgi:hypothetical protein